MLREALIIPVTALIATNPMVSTLFPLTISSVRAYLHTSILKTRCGAWFDRNGSAEYA